MFWDGTPEELERWLDDIFKKKKEPISNIVIDKIEG